MVPAGLASLAWAALALASPALAQPVPLGSEFQVNTYTTESQAEPIVARNSDGEFLIVWQGYLGSNEGLLGQGFDAAGNPLGGEFQISETAHYHGPAMSPDANGDFLLRFRNPQQVARRFDASGSPVGAEIEFPWRWSWAASVAPNPRPASRSSNVGPRESVRTRKRARLTNRSESPGLHRLACRACDDSYPPLFDTTLLYLL